MSRVRRFKMVSSGIAAVMFLAALLQLATPAAAFLNPVYATVQLSCHPGCRADVDPVRLLDREVQVEGWRTTGIEGRIYRRLEDPNVRALIVTARIVEAVPFLIFFLALAMAATNFARGGVTRASLRWIRRSAIGGLAWVVAEPIAHALNSKATMAVLRGQEEVHLMFSPTNILFGLAASGTAWLFVWVIEEALAAQNELREYI